MMEKIQALVGEIFEAVQGEGKYVGARQIFVSLSGCIHSCEYCDMDNTPKDEFSLGGSFYPSSIDPSTLFGLIRTHFDIKSVHSIAITGGEPLQHKEFLKQFAIEVGGSVKLYLETAGYSPSDIVEVSHLFDYLSIDIRYNNEDFREYLDRLLSAVGLISSSKVSMKFIDMLQMYAINEVWLQPIDEIFDINQVANWQHQLARKGVDGRFLPRIQKFIKLRQLA